MIESAQRLGEGSGGEGEGRQVETESTDCIETMDLRFLCMYFGTDACPKAPRLRLMLVIALVH